MEVSTKEASCRVGPHLGGNHSGFHMFLVSETHGACGFATKIDSDRQVIGRSGRFTAFTAHTILGSWRSSNGAGFVGGHLSHLEDICWAGADTLSATNTRAGSTKGSTGSPNSMGRSIPKTPSLCSPPTVGQRYSSALSAIPTRIYPSRSSIECQVLDRMTAHVAANHPVGHFEMQRQE